MNAKTYIAVKVGLLDPKHVKAMKNQSVFLYLHLLDDADWDTGCVKWTVADAAQCLGLTPPTIRKYQALLEISGNITTTKQRGYLESQIQNWTDPRKMVTEKSIAVPAGNWPTRKEDGKAGENGEKGTGKDRETVPNVSSYNPDGQMSKLPPSQRENSVPATVEANGGGFSLSDSQHEVRELLFKAGVRDKALDEIPALPHVTLQFVKDHIEALQAEKEEPGKVQGVGLLIHRLRHNFQPKQPKYTGGFTTIGEKW
jgi:hypothetical protein